MCTVRKWVDEVAVEVKAEVEVLFGTRMSVLLLSLYHTTSLFVRSKKQ